MLKYFGCEYSFKQLRDYVGDMTQLAGVKRYTHTSGRSKGVEAIDVRTGTGLSYTILADRALDISWAEFRGIPLCYISPVGVVAPEYYQPWGNEWLRSFGGGLLTTCGLDNVGIASERSGVSYGQHGRISNIPADNIQIVEDIKDDSYQFLIRGKVRQVKSFMEHLTLDREISSYAGESCINIKDTITNEGSERQPLMMLYHFNFGFPLFNENAMLTATVPCTACDAVGATCKMSTFSHFARPVNEIKEQVCVFNMLPDQNQSAGFLLMNNRENPQLGVLVRYDHTELDKLVIWKNLKTKNYVLCVEPANCHANGVAWEADEGMLRYIEPGEQIRTNLNIQVLDNKEQINFWNEQLSAVANEKCKCNGSFKE
jgi:hypothetical protein